MGGIFSSTNRNTGRSSETSTMTPNVPNWVEGPIHEYLSRADAMADYDPYLLAPRNNGLQTQANWDASFLGGWEGANQQAQDLALSAGQAPANLANGGRGYNAASTGYASQFGGVDVAPAAGYNANPSASVSLAPSTGYNATSAGQVSLGPAGSYTAATADRSALGEANTYTAATAAPVSLGPAASYNASTAGPVSVGSVGQAAGGGYSAAQAQTVDMGEADQAEAERAAYRSFMDGGLDRYQNPYLQNVVNATLADMDVNADRTRAAQLAAGAKNKALGGSRFGVAQALTEGELGRARASAEAQLRSAAFENAVRGAQFDTGNQLDINRLNAQLGTQTNLENMGARNRRAELQGQMDANVGMFNVGETNQARRTGAELGTQASIANAGFATQGALAQAELDANLGMHNSNLLTGASRDNANWANQMALAQGQISADLGMFNAGAQNQASQFNAGALNDFAGQRAGMEMFNIGQINQAGQFNTGAANQFALAQGDLNQQRNLFNAGAANDASRFGADAANQFALAQGQMDLNNNQFNSSQFNNAAQFNAGERNLSNRLDAQLANQTGLANMDARNQFTLDLANRMDEASQFSANAFNQNQQFNAGQQDNALARQLQSAGLLGDLANSAAGNVRSDIGLQAELGQQQWERDRAHALAPWEQLAMQGQAIGSLPLGMFTGNTTRTTGYNRGTQSSTPSPFQIGMSVASLFSDRRLKTDIEAVGEAKGHTVYRYRYIGEDRPRLGVMADEVERIAPDAVATHPSGYKMVNYAVLGLEHLVEA